MNKKFSVGKILLLAVLIVYTAFLFFPIVTVLLTSFVPSEELATATDFIWWSENFTLDAYKAIFAYDSYTDQVGMPGLILGFINTMWLTLIPLLIGLLMAGFSAYAFSKMNFPFKEKLFKFSVIIRSVPLGAFGVISYQTANYRIYIAKQYLLHPVIFCAPASFLQFLWNFGKLHRTAAFKLVFVAKIE